MLLSTAFFFLLSAPSRAVQSYRWRLVVFITSGPWRYGGAALKPRGVSAVQLPVLGPLPQQIQVPVQDRRDGVHRPDIAMLFQSLQGSFNTDESMHLILETNGLHEPRLSHA